MSRIPTIPCCINLHYIPVSSTSNPPFSFILRYKYFKSKKLKKRKKRELSGPLPGERWSDSFASLNTQLPLFTNFSFKLSPPEKLTYFPFCFHNLIIWLVVFLCNSFTPFPFPLISLSTLGLGSLLKAFLFTHLQHITNHKALMI